MQPRPSLRRLKTYKSVDAFCHVTFGKPPKKGKRSIIQDRFSTIRWRQHNPSWGETMEFAVDDEWEDT